MQLPKEIQQVRRFLKQEINDKHSEYQTFCVILDY